MACDQEFVPAFGPGNSFLNGGQIWQLVVAGRKTCIVKRQVQDISAQPTNFLGKRVVGVGDDQAVEFAGAISNELLGRSDRMTANLNLSHGFPFDFFRS